MRQKETENNWVIVFTWDFAIAPFYIWPLHFCFQCFNSLSLFILGNHSQISRAIVAIKVLDINDNAPEFATEYEAFLCENGKPGQVRGHQSGPPAASPSHSSSITTSRSKLQPIDLRERSKRHLGGLF